MNIISFTDFVYLCQKPVKGHEFLVFYRFIIVGILLIMRLLWDNIESFHIVYNVATLRLTLG